VLPSNEGVAGIGISIDICGCINIISRRAKAGGAFLFEFGHYFRKIQWERAEFPMKFKRISYLQLAWGWWAFSGDAVRSNQAAGAARQYQRAY